MGEKSGRKLTSRDLLKLGRSSDFRLSVVVILLGMIAFRFVNMWRTPDELIIPDSVLLTIAFIALSYLWLQELMDRDNLFILHKQVLNLQERQNQAVVETLVSFVDTIERKYPYMNGHSFNVSIYAQAIARKLTLESEEIERIKNAALLHDIGTSAVPDYILYKQEALSDSEWEEIRQHPLVSSDLLAPYPVLSQERTIVRAHHERYDGKGYPDGIKGEQIPLASRILAVSEAFEAMISQRAYRTNWLSQDFIVHELKANSGSQFDPRVVQALMDVLRNNPKLWMAPMRAQ